MKVNERGESEMIERRLTKRQGAKERVSDEKYEGTKGVWNERGGRKLKRCHKRKEIERESG